MVIDRKEDERRDRERRAGRQADRWPREPERGEAQR